MAREGRGWAALVVGFVLTVAGFALILYQVYVTTALPLNNYTYIGIAITGVGIALAGIGIDRGETRTRARG